MQRADIGTRNQQKESGPPVAAKSSAESVPSEIRVSPKARRLAREHGVDLKRVRGSGSDGEILAEDILSLAASPGANVTRSVSAGQGTTNSIARLMAERTAQSWTSVPHFFVFREIDAGGMLLAREKFRAAPDNIQRQRITYTDLLVFVTARVLLKHPRVNASWTGGEIHLHQQVNIGIAMAVEQGVVNIVIPGADTKTIGDIAALRLEMTERARSGRSRPGDLRDATFTISNLGMYKVDAFTAIIPVPQAAILAVGRIADRVVAVDGRVIVRPMMVVALSCDHRVIDGARAAEFLNDFADATSQPELWMGYQTWKME
jgi:pyruvate dehydrogenase E2 component (dihydrolipoamide acetyltransferase)